MKPIDFMCDINRYPSITNYLLMKRIIPLLTVFTISLLFISSCGERGPVGPRGPEGPQGVQGPEILPTSFEFNASLLPSNGFEFFNEIPASIEVIDSDVILAFVLEDFIPEDDLEVWRQLPITEFNSRGTVLINYDFTFVDVRIFLDANYPLGSADGYDELLIRAVHIPSNFAAKLKPNAFKDVSSPHELEALLGVTIKKAG